MVPSGSGADCAVSSKQPHCLEAHMESVMLGIEGVVQSLHHVWLWSHGLQHTRPPCHSLSPGACSVSCPLHRWCHPTISSSVIPFFSCPQSFPASGSFLMSQLFASGSQSFRASASASVLPMNIQDWVPLGWTGLISLQSKGLSRVFSTTTVWKHQSFSAQPSLWSNSHIHTWLLEETREGRRNCEDRWEKEMMVCSKFPIDALGIEAL